MRRTYDETFTAAHTPECDEFLQKINNHADKLWMSVKRRGEKLTLLKKAH